MKACTHCWIFQRMSNKEGYAWYKCHVCGDKVELKAVEGDAA